MSNKVSICIPSYKRTHFLKRLLDSILSQTYKNYEVIISDDSDDNSVQDLVMEYKDKMDIKYHRNSPALGTPKNWMSAISKASGEWIKLIHDDDWFAEPDSLTAYIDAASAGNRFIFSGYNAYYEEREEYVNKTVNEAEFDMVQQHPFKLLYNNIIGPPSVLMFHKSVNEYYEPDMKWLVDIEYYISVLTKEKATYISKPLINMSYNDSQVTNSCLNNPEVEIPELLYITTKYDNSFAKDIMTYDAFWRSIRNNGIRSKESLKKYANGYNIPLFINNIVSFQKNIPLSVLKIGACSKLLMLISHMFNSKNI